MIYPPMNAMAAMVHSKQSFAPSPQSDNIPRPPSSSPAPSPAAGPNAMMGGPLPPQSRAGRVDPALMASLPPEYAAFLTQLGHFVDLDGDGTPDIAVVPLYAMAQMRGGQ